MNRPIPVPPCCTSTDYSGPSALEPQPGTRFWLACNQSKQKTNKLQSITVKWMLSNRVILPSNRLFNSIHLSSYGAKGAVNHALVHWDLAEGQRTLPSPIHMHLWLINLKCLWERTRVLRRSHRHRNSTHNGPSRLGGANPEPYCEESLFL